MRSWSGVGRSTPSPARDVPFEHAVYPPLIDRGELDAFVTRHRYYSVGTLARLPETERFLGASPAVILDRDGVLNERPAARGVHPDPRRAALVAGGAGRAEAAQSMRDIA